MLGLVLGYRIQDTSSFHEKRQDTGVLFTRKDRIQKSYSPEETGYRSPIHQKIQNTVVLFTRRYRIQESYSPEDTGYRSPIY